MFRIINKKSKITFYNLEKHGFKLVPTKNSYKLLRNDKDVTDEYIVSVSANILDDKGRMLYTEDRVDFNTLEKKFCFGTIKYNGNFVIQTKSEKINLCDVAFIHLADEYSDDIHGLYL